MKKFITSHLEEAVTGGPAARGAAMAADHRKTSEDNSMTKCPSYLGSEAMYLGRGMCACEIGRRERYDAGRDRVSLTVGVTESTVEAAALEWLGSLGWKVVHGPDIAPGAAEAERTEYGEVSLERRLLAALDRMNPDLPAEAVEDAFRKLTRPDGSTLEARNHPFLRMLVDGVTVEYRTDGGALRRAQVSIHIGLNNPRDGRSSK